MEPGAGPDLEIGIQEEDLRVDGHAAPAVMDGIGRIGVYEFATGHDGRHFDVRQCLHRFRWWKYVGKQEKAQSDAEPGAQGTANQKERRISPHPVNPQRSRVSAAEPIRPAGAAGLSTPS